jgi:uncharacterized membrane protein (TIGR02234 family)
MADRPATGERRTFAAAAGTGVACAALSAVASGKPWVDVPHAMGQLGPTATLSNVLEPYAESASALALALVALASWGVLLVVRGRARTLMAAIGLAFAAGLLAVAALGYGQVPDAVRQAMVQQLGTQPGSAARTPMPHTGWYWLCVVAAVGDVLALVIAVRRAHRWPAMGARYDAPGTGAPGTAVPGEQDMWRTLDQGRDPTDPGSA